MPLPEHPFDAEVVVPIASGKTPFRTLAERGETLARPAVRFGQLLDQCGPDALEKALACGAVAAESVAYLLQESHRDAPPAATVAVLLPDNPRARIAVARSASPPRWAELPPDTAPLVTRRVVDAADSVARHGA